MKRISFSRNIIICLLVTPLVAFSSRFVFAFSITPPRPIDTIPTKELKSLIENRFEPAGWTFSQGANLQG